MEIPVLDGIVKETKGHPYTMIVLVALMLAVPYIYRNSASADDLRVVQAQLTTLQASTTKNSLEAQLRAVKGELFTRNKEVSDLKAARKTVADIYYDRIRDLEADKDRLERELLSYAKTP